MRFSSPRLLVLAASLWVSALARGVRHLADWAVHRSRVRDPRVGCFGFGWREAPAWSCRCCICCFVVRLRSRRCVSARVSSRSSRSWCCATSSRFFAARSLVRGSTSETGCSSLRPAGCCRRASGPRSRPAPLARIPACPRRVDHRVRLLHRRDALARTRLRLRSNPAYNIETGLLCDSSQ